MFYVNNTTHDSINPNFPWIFHNLHQMFKKVHSSSVEYLLGTEASDKGRRTQSELELSRMRIIEFIHISPLILPPFHISRSIKFLSRSIFNSI